MGRSKKAAAVVHHSDDSDQDEAPPAPAPPATAAEQQPSVVPSATTSADEAKHVEVKKTDKKKVTTTLKGLEQYGVKLSVAAAQLKKMVGPVELVKADGSEFLEFQGDVAPLIIKTLTTKFSVPASSIVSGDVPPPAPAPAQKAAPAKAEKDVEEASSDDEDSDSDGDDGDVVITKRKAIKVNYCPVCTYPAEMCEYSGMFEKCKPWLMEQLEEEEAAALADATEKGRKRRVLTDQEKLEQILEGKGKKKVEKEIVMDVKARTGRTKVTIVSGLDLFGLNLVDISQEFKKIFSCGSGVVEEKGRRPCVEIQGNVVSRLCEMLPAKYNIPQDLIYFMENKTKVALVEKDPK